MADQKVSNLPALNGADVDSADLLYIVDSSAGTAGSKKITIGQYQLAPVSGGTANGVTYLNGSKVQTSGSALTFDGTNLGIGTSSPAGKVDSVANATAAYVARASTTGANQTANALVAFNSDASLYALARYRAVQHIWDYNGTTEGMRLDASGNLGLGVTPANWSGLSNAGVIETQSYALVNIGTNAVDFTQNAIGDGAGNYKYRTTEFASKYGQVQGRHQWFTAPSGTAGNVITFTQAMTLTSGGDLLVGATSAATFTPKLAVVAPGNQQGLEAQSNTVNYYAGLFTNTATSGDNFFLYFGTEANGATQRGSITYNRAGGLVAYNTTSDYRAKDILGPVSNPGATIDALKVYEGQMKGATQSRPMLVAHEAQAVVPYSVTGEKDAVNEDGTPKFQQMDVSSLVPLLIAEIQSLRARVAALEAK